MNNTRILLYLLVICGVLIIVWVFLFIKDKHLTSTPKKTNVQIESLNTDSMPPPKNFRKYQNGLYIVFTDIDENSAKKYLQFANKFRAYFNNHFYTLKNQTTNIYIYKRPEDYQSANKCESVYGCYLFRFRLIITHHQSGIGTLAHELVHGFISDGLNHIPNWLYEGLPTLFEKLYGYYDDNGNLKLLYGFSNPWREQEFASSLGKGRLSKPSLLEVAQHKSSKDAERLLALYLYQRNWFTEYLKYVKKTSSTDNNAEMIRKVSGKTQSQLESDWALWLDEIIKNVNSSKSTLKYVPTSFVLTNKTSWDEWMNENRFNPIFRNLSPE